MDCNPESVALIDESTGEKVADLYDLADYERYGDTIQGDAVYNCRFKVNIDIENSNDFQKLTLEEKAKFAENRLHELEKDGYIKKNSIVVSDKNISFEYS